MLPLVEAQLIRRSQGKAPETIQDRLIAEEPLEIRLNDEPIAVLMRTPGDDIALAVGFLFSEGILSDPGQVLSAAHCRDPENLEAANIVRVLAQDPDLQATEQARRRVYASSSCGLCGKTTLDSVRLLCPSIKAMKPISAELLLGLPARMRLEQKLFEDTGALHAAGLFSNTGELIAAREDIGRHNACDKILGTMALREQWPLSDRILVLSGRASFEMVQKAAMAGIGAVVAVSAPSSLAVDLARELGLTLVGFVRQSSLNVYSGTVTD
ncbi:MAG: sulfurtransferase FdhD [Rickettsiales bacterium]|nr:sulfurtransferase FdhD [Rickettsiales bacterium]|tara:strand:+ start:1242 stop:2048 length:807 start_codon:yes stop_codon:yes gene_type:complete